MFDLLGNVAMTGLHVRDSTVTEIHVQTLTAQASVEENEKTCLEVRCILADSCVQPLR